MKLSKDDIHVMVDIETLSTRTNAVVLSIGAVKFDYFDSNISSFYLILDGTGQEHRHISPETEKWWESQGGEAQEVFDAENKIGTYQACVEFSKFLGDADYVWAKSPSFDLAILKSLFEDLGIVWPVPYYREADVRTANLLFPETVSKVKPNHNALCDSILQVEGVRQAIIKAISRDEHKLPFGVKTIAYAFFGTVAALVLLFAHNPLVGIPLLGILVLCLIFTERFVAL